MMNETQRSIKSCVWVKTYRLLSVWLYCMKIKLLIMSKQSRPMQFPISIILVLYLINF